MNKKIFSTLLIILLLGGISVHAEGLIFKIPKDVFPMDWNKSKFKGLLFLHQKSPSGIFVASPDEGETIEQLRERAAKFIAPMVSDASKEDNEIIPFEVNSIAANKGDAEDGKYYLYTGEKGSVQILFYIRKKGNSNFLYGYFASNNDNNIKNKRWADKNGKGVKLFQNFVKTIK